MKEKPFVSVIVYVHNNEHEIAPFLRSIDKTLRENFEAYETVLVDDHSTDRTLEYAKEAIKDVGGSFSIIHLSRTYNVEIAMLAGADKSIGDFVFEMDSPIIDYPMELIMEVYKKAINGYDIVAAVPHIHMKLGDRLFYSLVNMFSPLDLHLAPESFRIVSRRALNSILNITEKTRYRKGLHSYIGFSKTNITYDKVNKQSAIAKRSFPDKIALGLDIIVSFTNLPLIIALSLSLVLFLFSIAIGGYTLYNYLFLENVADTGWPSTMAFLAIAFSGIFFILGIISNYASKILIEAQDRPLYNIASIE